MLKKYQNSKINDTVFLNICINLAKKHLPKTSPNPSVGCVIVKDGVIISTGITSENGRPHAEHNAIKKISGNQQLSGSTLYVSLEPCCHHGKTAPCADLIINSKISRVVIAAIDSDKRMSGKSIELLRQKGIIVDLIEINDAYEVNKTFFKTKSSQTPYVTLKIASSLDGKIALNNGQSKWITSSKSREHGHHLRYLNDAILIGKNTLIQDNPSLDCRIKGLEGDSPTKVIIANKLDFDSNYKVFNNVKTIVIYSDQNVENQENLHKFTDTDKNIELLGAPSVDGLIDLEYCLKELSKLSINSVLIEGGSAIATSFLKQNLVDKITWFRSSKIIGSDGRNAIAEMGFTQMNEVICDFKLESVKKIDDSDVLSIYKK